MFSLLYGFIIFIVGKLHSFFAKQSSENIIDNLIFVCPSPLRYKSCSFFWGVREIEIFEYAIFDYIQKYVHGKNRPFF